MIHQDLLGQEGVVDPVAGSGSTLVAAENLGRKAFGFEIKKDFYKQANEWIEDCRIARDERKSIGFSLTSLRKKHQDTLPFEAILEPATSR